MNVRSRVAELETVASVGAGECQCASMDGVSGLRVTYEPESGAPTGAMSDTVAICQVCGKPRPTLRVVYDGVSEQQQKDGEL